MIDDDDGLLFLLAWPVIGPVSFVLLVLGLLFFSWRAAQNEDECAVRKCDAGVPRLLDGECVCAGAPK